MNRATCAVLCVSFLLAGLLFGPVPSNQAPAQPGANPPAVGRFQVVMDNKGAPALLIDTATGQVWRNGGAAWLPQINPVK